VADAGVSDRVEILFEDYRRLSGRYSKLASIEMIEAVGWQYFDLFFRRCSELLEPGGRMLLQAITIEDDRYELEKATRSFINTYVFPAGCLPSLQVIRDCMSRTGLAELGLEDLSASYPLTLRAWRERFLAAREEVRAMGYDERFMRLWELYLSWCEGGFREGRIQDYQMLARRQPSSTTDRMLPDGSVNQAMSGPGPRKTPSSSVSTSVPS
jgi:cyclopropane-fatty-acyl-phospholipid synthase